VAGAIGWVLSAMVRDYVQAVGTSIIGAGIFMLGLNQYLPGLPDIFAQGGVSTTSFSGATAAYLAAFTVLVIGGSLF